MDKDTPKFIYSGDKNNPTNITNGHFLIYKPTPSISKDAKVVANSKSFTSNKLTQKKIDGIMIIQIQNQVNQVSVIKENKLCHMKQDMS